MNKSEWPEWLRRADTRNAAVTIKHGRVWWHDGEWLGGEWLDGEWCGGEWHSGVWRDGTWYDGTWYGGKWLGGVWLNGVWHDGVWLDGEWRSGVWRSGEWYSGVWHRGKWRGGAWHGGEWHDGDWLGGVCTPNRSMRPVLGNATHATIGCQTRTYAEWDSVLYGEVDPPYGAPPIGSAHWHRLCAAYVAVREYHRELRARGVDQGGGDRP